MIGLQKGSLPEADTCDPEGARVRAGGLEPGPLEQSVGGCAYYIGSNVIFERLGDPDIGEFKDAVILFTEGEVPTDLPVADAPQG